MLRFSRSCGSVLHVLLSYLKVTIFQPCASVPRILLSYSKVAILQTEHESVAIFQPELRRFTARTRATFELQSCDFPAGAAKVYLAYYFRTQKLRFSSRSAKVYFARCNFPAGAAKVYCAYACYFCTPKLRSLSRTSCGPQGGIEPATAGLRKQARKPRDNFQRPLRAQRRSESTSTRTIYAEGSPRLSRTRAGPQRERLDRHDPRTIRGPQSHICPPCEGRSGILKSSKCV